MDRQENPALKMQIIKLNKLEHTVNVLRAAVTKQIGELNSYKIQVDSVIQFSDIVKPYFDKFKLKDVVFKLDKVRLVFLITLN